MGIGWVGGEGKFLVKERKCHSDVADRGRKVVDRKEIEGVAKTAAGKDDVDASWHCCCFCFDFHILNIRGGGNVGWGGSRFLGSTPML